MLSHEVSNDLLSFVLSKKNEIMIEIHYIAISIETPDHHTHMRAFHELFPQRLSVVALRFLFTEGKLALR